MKCVIGSTNVKDFGRAVHSLAKIGDELYIEPGQSGVSCRTISSSRSAYFSYNFESSFFTHYDGGMGGQTAAEEDTLRCKVAMKAVLNIFKGIHSLERTVQRCKLVLKWDEAKLIIQLSCHYGIVKTHNIAFIECDALQAVYNKESCPNSVVSEPRVLLDALSSFHQQTLEEISFCFTSRNLVLKTHIEEPDPSKVVHTLVTLTFGEFEAYNIKNNCELTVCLKEIRALLTFLGSVGLSTKAYFSDPGSPIIFTFDSKPLYEGTLVLATLVQKPEVVNRAANRSGQEPRVSPPSRKDSSGVGETPPRNNTSGDSGANITSVQNVTPEAANAEPGGSCLPPPMSHQDALNSDASQGATLIPSSDNNRMAQEDEEEEDEPVSSSPPAKKGRFFFRRCFESTFNPESLPGHNIILAEDSDEGY